MFEETDQEYLFYSIHKKHYKIKTFGKIVKIIDFGRGVVNFNNEWFMSDVFSLDCIGYFNFCIICIIYKINF